MRRFATLAVCVLAGFWAGPVEAGSDGGAGIVLEIGDVEPERGVLRCGLYTESNWLESEDAVEWVEADYGEEDIATCRFDDIESGTYGVGVFHDEDADHEMDSNVLGIPSEGVCASNDPEGSMGPPEFQGAKFSHDGSDRTGVSCTMRY
jgi:uncharacterized protein (DUF2141 family)